MLRLTFLGLILLSHACIPNTELQYPQTPTSFDETSKFTPLNTRTDAEVLEKDQTMVTRDMGMDMQVDMIIIEPTRLKTSSVQWMGAPIDRPEDGADPTRIRPIEGAFLWHFDISPMISNTP